LQHIKGGGTAILHGLDQGPSPESPIGRVSRPTLQAGKGSNQSIAFCTALADNLPLSLSQRIISAVTARGSYRRTAILQPP
jgi:hypothetical protein